MTNKDSKIVNLYINLNQKNCKTYLPTQIIYTTTSGTTEYNLTLKPQRKLHQINTQVCVSNYFSVLLVVDVTLTGKIRLHLRTCMYKATAAGS